MKKKLCLLSILILLLTTGCIKRDSFEGIDIYTTIYPTEYITERLYGEHSNIFSIYPDGVDVDTYEPTEKLLKDYSKCSLVIFNGMTNEKNYVISMYKNNNNLKIIDSTISMEYTNSNEELWLNPLNFLMMTQNIKEGLKQYISNHYLRNNIDEKYEELKLEISTLDAKIKLMIENSDDKVIVVSSDLFKYLEKYNLNVISLEENENLTEKTIESVKDLIKNGSIKYIYLKDTEEANDTIKSIINDTEVTLVKLRTLSNITEEERDNNEDYISIMNNNLELIKQEIYN